MRFLTATTGQDAGRDRPDEIEQAPEIEQPHAPAPVRMAVDHRPQHEHGRHADRHVAQPGRDGKQAGRKLNAQSTRNMPPSTRQAWTAVSSLRSRLSAKRRNPAEA